MGTKHAIQAIGEEIIVTETVVLFGCAHNMDKETVELVICQPDDKERAPGDLAPEYAGMRVDALGPRIRVLLTPIRIAAIMEVLSEALLAMNGVEPPIDRAAECRTEN